MKGEMMNCTTMLAVVGLVALTATGCSKKPSDQGATTTAAGAPAAASAAAAITIRIPANQDVIKTVALPAGTHSVTLATGAVSFSCKHVSIKTQAGGVSNNFTNSDVPAKLSMTDSTSAGNTYVSVDVSCHGGAADSQLVLTPSS
jgi:hypothetical protein